MSIGSPIGPDIRVTTSEEVDRTLRDTTVSFGDVVVESGAAKDVHWLVQASAEEVLLACKDNPGGGMLAAVHLIERTDDEGRTWVCITSSAWTAGLFLSRPEGLDFARGVAARETPEGGWDYAFTREVPAASYIRLA